LDEGHHYAPGSGQGPALQALRAGMSSAATWWDGRLPRLSLLRWPRISPWPHARVKTSEETSWFSIRAATIWMERQGSVLERTTGRV